MGFRLHYMPVRRTIGHCSILNVFTTFEIGASHMTTKFRLSAEDIQPLAEGYGACFATNMITVDGFPVRFMYREAPDDELDSGWRFMSGFEDDDYIDNPDNYAIYDVNTIANYDPTIIPLLDSAEGCAFEKRPDSDSFEAVTSNI